MNMAVTKEKTSHSRRPHPADSSTATSPLFASFDRWLLFATIMLIVIGLTMVASASIVVSEKLFQHPFHFLIRQIIYMGLGVVAAAVVLNIRMESIQKLAPLLLIAAFILLALVLIPGIGREVNGSRRWIGLGPIGMQVSELAKLFAIIYIGDYLVRRNEEVRMQIMGFIKPMIVLGLLSILLLKEPNFGAATVIIVTALGMMFLAGVRLGQFVLLVGFVGSVLVGLAFSSPYRLARLTSFLNPWSNQFDSGYQLTQALIAFGRGGWFGLGLGDSVQKLFYLPEAHTDFLFAVFAEEIGLIGVIVVIALFCIVVGRAFVIARRSIKKGHMFGGYLAYGLGLLLAMQAMINIGVNSGVLPTKGLTLPLMSYGGSSMIVMLVVIALLFRINYEAQ